MTAVRKLLQQEGVSMRG